MSGPADPGSVHGHVVLRWLTEQPMRTPELQARIERELGSAARFHTCDTAGLTADALIALLATRGKIVEGAQGWSTDTSRICDDA